MCGRARCTLRPDDVPRACHRHGVPARFIYTDRFRASYNIAPGASMPVLRRDNGGDGSGDGVAVHCMKWGLVPSFTKKAEKPDFFKMFNARSESVSEKASFRRLLPKNRCLVTVEGFYEWKKDGSKKQPYYIHFKDERPLVFAALYDTWQNSEGEILYTFTILTTTSSPVLQWLHDRMPVILGDKESVDMWLDDPSTSKLKTILKPYESPDLVWYAVTPAIGKTSFDGPECIQEIPLKAAEKNLISKFFSAKQPKMEETNREVQSVSENVVGGLKEEPRAEDCKGAAISGNIKKNEELGEEKRYVPDEATKMDFKNIVKAEPLTQGGSTVTSSVKVETDEGPTSIPHESINMGQTSSLELNEVTTITDTPQRSKEESGTPEYPDTEKEEPCDSTPPHVTVKEKPQSEDHAVVTSSNEREESESKPHDLDSCGYTSGKSGTKRDYDVYVAQQKPSKQSEKARELKSSEKSREKLGQRKFDLKNSGEKQSTLHWFFEKK